MIPQTKIGKYIYRIKVIDQLNKEYYSPYFTIYVGCNSPKIRTNVTLPVNVDYESGDMRHFTMPNFTWDEPSVFCEIKKQKIFTL